MTFINKAGGFGSMFLSYIVSWVSLVNGETIVTLITAAAGASFTAAGAYKEYQNAKYRKQETISLELKNKETLLRIEAEKNKDGGNLTIN